MESLKSRFELNWTAAFLLFSKFATASSKLALDMGDHHSRLLRTTHGNVALQRFQVVEHVVHTLSLPFGDSAGPNEQTRGHFFDERSPLIQSTTRFDNVAGLGGIVSVHPDVVHIADQIVDRGVEDVQTADRDPKRTHNTGQG